MSTVRTFRRCGCTEIVNGKRRQLGRTCPKLPADPSHGTWTFSVPIPASLNRRHPWQQARRTRAFVRGGYATQQQAAEAGRAALTRATNELTTREPPPRHEPKRRTVDGKRVRARRAADLVETGECTPACLLAAEEICVCRCGERFHGALADAPAYPCL